MNETFNSQKADEFAAALTKLGHEYGIGITGNPVLFMLEPDDADRQYICDEASVLQF